MSDFSDRLQEARRSAGYAKAVDAIRAFGWVEATYYQHENGTRDPDRDQLAKYAKAYHVSVDWLWTGRVQGAARTRKVPLIGRMGIQAQVEFYAEHSAVKALDVNVEDRDSVGAIEVLDDESYPSFMRGDIVYVGPDEDPVALVGLQCMVTTHAGLTVFRVIERGSVAGRYTLIGSAAGGPPLRDIEIDRAAFVTWIKHARRS